MLVAYGGCIICSIKLQGSKFFFFWRGWFGWLQNGKIKKNKKIKNLKFFLKEKKKCRSRATAFEVGGVGEFYLKLFNERWGHIRIICRYHRYIYQFIVHMYVCTK